MEECGNPACRKACENPNACPRCKAVPYCSRACQKAHYQQHKKICGHLNADKALQLQHPDHLKHVGDAFARKLIAGLSMFSRECQELFRLSMSATKGEDPRVTASTLARMNSLASRIDLIERQRLLFPIIPIIIVEKKWRVTSPTSLVLVLLNSGVDASALSLPWNQSSPDQYSYTALHQLAKLASPDDLRVNENQIIVGRQLIEAGANVNGRAGSKKFHCTPLHNACSSKSVINLDFIELLLDHGADPNLQDSLGQTPLMYTVQMAMPAAELLLTYDYSNGSSVPINVNVQTRNGSTMLGSVRQQIIDFQLGLAGRMGVDLRETGLTTTDQFEYLLNQLRGVETLLVSKGAIDNGWQSSRVDTDNHDDADNIPPLPYDVGALFDKDLSDASAAPSWYSPKCFYIDDGTTRQFEAMEKIDHLHGSDGKRPALDQKIRIHFILRKGVVGRLTGEVSELGPVPTDAQLKRSDSFVYGVRCPSSIPKCPYTRTGSRAEILCRYGAVHGQEVKGVVSLASEYHDDSVCRRFFRGADARYTVVLRCNDKSTNIWQMVKISPHISSCHEESQEGEIIMCAQGCGSVGSTMCSRCQQVKYSYCSRACQKKHWPLHKQACRKKRDKKLAKQDAP